MSFIRPELAQTLSRYREPALAALVVLIGLRIALIGGYLFQGLGAVVLLIALGWFWVALRRARFPAAQGGSGVVEVDERQIAYYGPSAGGVVSINALTLVEVETNSAGPFAPDLHWLFHSDDGPALRIPGDARGVEALFDALSALPGADYGRAAEAAASTRNAKFVIWRKDPPKLH